MLSEGRLKKGNMPKKTDLFHFEKEKFILGELHTILTT